MTAHLLVYGGGSGDGKIESFSSALLWIHMATFLVAMESLSIDQLVATQ